MKFVPVLKPALLLVITMAFMPLLMPSTASAEVTTINADLGRCKTNVDHYQIQLQSRDYYAPARDFPASVTLTFENGVGVEATPFSGPNGGTVYYYYFDNSSEFVGVAVTGATAQFDTEKYPNYLFTVTARPCIPTYDVTGDVVQQGNGKPVADLSVCVVGTDLCTTTDANGSFALTGLTNGTYTLVTNGNNWKPQEVTVIVDGGNVHVEVVQQKGGGVD